MTRDAWAHLADRYEQAYGPKTNSPCWRRAVALAESVDGPVLDLGCGPGYELALFRQGVGIDRSPGMLAAARRRAPQAHLVRCDMRHLPFGRESFAGAFSCLALIHLKKAALAATLAQVRGMLRPGAPLVAVFFAGTGERVTGFSPLDGSAFAQYAFYESAELRALVEQAGFSAVSIEDDILVEPTNPAIPCLCVSASA
ncbi:MAG: class I SAM-dependent methyltransferase [Dehalococcoidia bacterium]